MDELQAVLKQIRESRGHRAEQTVDRLQVGFYILSRNRDELKPALEKVADPTFTFALLAMKAQDPSDIAFTAILSEVSRLLHNYLAAARSVVEHTRNIIKSEYRGTPVHDEYMAEVQRRFMAPMPKFVQDLRGFFLHYDLGTVGAQFNFKSSSGYSSGVYIPVKRLREYGRWSKEAEVYLSNADTQLDIMDVIAAYSRVAEDFQEWLVKLLARTHRGDFAELSGLQEAAKRLLDESQKGGGVIEARLPLDHETAPL
jgi:hypothetical protein